eukprot:TRINITY_DN7892_c0_g1_i3.p1 TRINITY_DN7892_c0_g1~~TRINITY_DN7892_c0_g1_i3.p1  ORF type:complete len:246 (+),score=37.27 TRINITY_DN7892_c0_g1_i3:721-1458(+)
MKVVDGFRKHWNLPDADAVRMYQRLIGEWNPQDSVAIAAERAWTSQEVFPSNGKEFCSIFGDAVREGYAVQPVAVYARALHANLNRFDLVKQKTRGWPGGPNVPKPHTSTQENVTWRGGGFKDIQSVRDFFSDGQEYRVAQPLATAFDKDVASTFIDRAQVKGPVNAFVMWKINVDCSKGCKQVNLLLHSHCGWETEFLYATFSAFKVLHATWNAGTQQDPHLIEVAAFSDNLDAPEDLPLAPWC